MAGAFIDPAESFSRALGQGLATFKSYRDEARQDEDRDFNKKMALRLDERSERQLAISEGTFDMAKENNEYAKSRRPFQEKVDQANLTGLELGNEGKRIDNEWQPKLNAENIRSSRDASARGWAGINIQRGELALRQQAFRAEQAQNDQSNFLRSFVSGVSSGDMSAVTRNPGAATKTVVTMASLAYGSPVLSEALQNPFGAWRNDPKKVDQLMPFADLSGLTGGTARQRGYGRDTRVVDMEATKVKTPDGKVVPGFRFVFEGTNTKTGKRERFDAYQNAEKFLDKAHAYQSVFGSIGNRKDAQARLAYAFGSANPKEFDEIVRYEVDKRERAIKQLESTAGPKNRAMAAQLKAELNQIYDGDPETVGSIVFKRLGQAGAVRY